MLYSIPDHEIDTAYSHSSGAGGQNVNKRDTKAQIRWPFRISQNFSDDQKFILEQTLHHWINNDGYIVIANQESRSQEQNRQNAIDRLHLIVNEALTPEKNRIPTRPTRSSKERRLTSKKKESNKKTSRKVQEWEL